MTDYELWIKGKEVTTILYTTTDCTVCKSFAPKIAELLHDMEIPMQIINLQTTPHFVSEVQVMGVPTLLVYFDSKEIMRVNAYVNLNELRDKLIRLQETSGTMKAD